MPDAVPSQFDMTQVAGQSPTSNLPTTQWITEGYPQNTPNEVCR